MTTNEAFWAESVAGRLVLPECGACSTRFFPPAPACPTCHDPDWAWVPSSGAGAVYSHTTCQRPHVAGIDAPYVLAVVELDDGWTLVTNIVGEGKLEARTGDRVTVGFVTRPVGSEMLPSPVFTLDSPADAYRDGRRAARPSRSTSIPNSK